LSFFLLPMAFLLRAVSNLTGESPVKVASIKIHNDTCNKCIIVNMNRTLGPAEYWESPKNWWDALPNGKGCDLEIKILFTWGDPVTFHMKPLHKGKTHSVRSWALQKTRVQPDALDKVSRKELPPPRNYNPSAPGQGEYKRTGDRGGVWMVMDEGPSGMIYFADFAPHKEVDGGAFTAHMQLFETVRKRLPAGGCPKPLFAGSLKNDGSFSGNSAFNDPECLKCVMRYKGMNGPIRVDAMQNYGHAYAGVPFSNARAAATARKSDLPCSPQRLKWVQDYWARAVHV